MDSGGQNSQQKPPKKGTGSKSKKPSSTDQKKKGSKPDQPLIAEEEKKSPEQKPPKSGKGCCSKKASKPEEPLSADQESKGSKPEKPASADNKEKKRKSCCCQLNVLFVSLLAILATGAIARYQYKRVMEYEEKLLVQREIVTQEQETSDEVPSDTVSNLEAFEHTQVGYHGKSKPDKDEDSKLFNLAWAVVSRDEPTFTSITAEVGQFRLFYRSRGGTTGKLSESQALTTRKCTDAELNIGDSSALFQTPLDLDSFNLNKDAFQCTDSTSPLAELFGDSQTTESRQLVLQFSYCDQSSAPSGVTCEDAKASEAFMSGKQIALISNQRQITSLDPLATNPSDIFSIEERAKALTVQFNTLVKTQRTFKWRDDVLLLTKKASQSSNTKARLTKLIYSGSDSLEVGALDGLRGDMVAFELLVERELDRHVTHLTYEAPMAEAEYVLSVQQPHLYKRMATAAANAGGLLFFIFIISIVILTLKRSEAKPETVEKTDKEKAASNAQNEAGKDEQVTKKTVKSAAEKGKVPPKRKELLSKNNSKMNNLEGQQETSRRLISSKDPESTAFD